MAFALEEVHSIEAKGFDFDEGLGAFWGRLRNIGVDV